MLLFSQWNHSYLLHMKISKLIGNPMLRWPGTFISSNPRVWWWASEIWRVSLFNFRTVSLIKILCCFAETKQNFSLTRTTKKFFKYNHCLFPKPAVLTYSVFLIYTPFLRVIKNKLKLKDLVYCGYLSRHIPNSAELLFFRAHFKTPASEAEALNFG